MTDHTSANGESTDNNRTNSAGYYGRPQYRLSYRSNRINALAFKTFKTRHAAVGERARLKRIGAGEAFDIEYRSEYDHERGEVTGVDA